MMVKNKVVNFQSVKSELLEKTSFSEKAIHNVAKSMISEVVQSEKKRHIVYVESQDLNFVFEKEENLDEVQVYLKDIIAADVYKNSGIVTRKISKGEIMH